MIKKNIFVSPTLLLKLTYSISNFHELFMYKAFVDLFFLIVFFHSTALCGPFHKHKTDVSSSPLSSGFIPFPVTSKLDRSEVNSNLKMASLIFLWHLTNSKWFIERMSWNNPHHMFICHLQ